MAVSDKIIVTRSALHMSPDEKPVPVYKAPTTPEDIYIEDRKGYVLPTFVGGVKVGTEGIIIGQPCKARKSDLKEYEGGIAPSGDDFVLLYPVQFIQYKQQAWIPADFIQIVA